MRCIAILCVLCLTGCLSSNVRDMLHKGEVGQGFVSQRFVTSTFVLTGLLRPARTSAKDVNHAPALHIYIEGDGYAWVTRTQPARDPTPKKPTALYLAQADPTAAAILYLARPCQYVTGHDARQCSPRYWTSARFSPEVLQSMQEAIAQAKERVGAQRIALIGYSGGGGLAALLASQRDDVYFLGSVAGTLDHAAWTRWHKVSPLRESRNAVDYVYTLKNIPQRHLTSYDDTIVPPATQQQYCQAITRPQPCIAVRGLSHDGAWEKVWNYTYK